MTPGRGRSRAEDDTGSQTVAGGRWHRAAGGRRLKAPGHDNDKTRRSLKGSARPFFHPPGSHPSLGDHPLPSSAHTGALRRSLPASPPHRPTHVRTLFCQTLRGRRIPAAGPTFGSLTVPSRASQKKKEPGVAKKRAGPRNEIRLRKRGGMRRTLSHYFDSVCSAAGFSAGATAVESAGAGST